jgi:N-methylhydantoinase B
MPEVSAQAATAVEVGATDPVLMEILANRFTSVTEEMGHTLQRTSHTVFVNETADFATGLSTPGGELFAYPRALGVAVMVNLDLGEALASFDTYEPGDIVITNDPYTSGAMASHLPDVNMFKPVFVEGEVIGFAWAYVHSTDVGGKVPGSLSPTSDDVYQEGVRIRPSKLYRAGELDQGVLNQLLDNSRVPGDSWGDVKATVAALNTGESRLIELAGQYGTPRVRRAMDDVLEYAEDRARELFRRIPDGAYEFSDFLDSDVVSDVPIRLAVRLEAADGLIHLDYGGCDIQSSSAFNIPSLGKTHPWVTYRLISFLYSSDPRIPINAGLLRGVTANLPEGSIVNCTFPAAVGLRTTTSLRLMDVIHGALVKALPGGLPAAPGGATTPVVLAEPDPESGGRRVMTLEPLVGGTGGSDSRDGVDARDVGLSNLRNNPIEVLEAESSLIVREYGVRRDSGGPGRYRGGTGVVLEFEAGVPGTAITARGMERQRFRAWGVAGGRCGAGAEAVLNPGRSDERELRKIDLLRLEPGEVVRITTPGGGGYGDPFERDPELVMEDVRRDAVSLEHARAAYGVAIVDGGVDAEATAALRAAPRELAADFDFGPEREAHERVWSPAMYEKLAAILAELPQATRPHARLALFKAVGEELEDADPDALAAIWGRIGERLRGRR